MGFFGDVATSLLVMKVDTSQMRAGLRTLKGEEKELVKAQIESAEARNRAIEGYGKSLVKINTLIGTATKALQFGTEAFKAYEENAVLSAASAKYNIDALRKSSAGLKSDVDLMRLAQKAAGSQHAVTQEQLENATKAARAFEAAGFDGAKVQEKLGEALLKGSIEPLKDLGVNLDAAKGKTGQMAQLMEVLGQKAKGAGAGINEQTDEFRKAGVEYQNAMNQLKVAIGEIVVSLAPLIGALAKVVGLVADIARNAGASVSDAPIFSISGAAGGKYGYGFGAGANDQFAGAGRVMGQLNALDASRAAQVNAVVQTTMGIANSGFKPPQPRKSGGGKKKDEPLYFITNERTGEIMPVYAPPATGNGFLGQDFGFQQGDVASWGAGGAGPSGDMLARASAGMGADRAAELAKQASGYGAFQAAKQQSLLEGIFGPIEEFDAYSTAFNALTSTLTAGFDAWVSGSMSAGAAMKKAFSDAVAGAASQMFSQAILHGAYAIGSLAFGNFAGAATHAKAAAAFGAGALVAGGIARQLGGGAQASGGGASAGGGRAPSVIGGGGGSGGGSSNITVIVGDIWAMDNQRKKDRDVARAIRSAERELQGAQGVQRR